MHLSITSKGFGAFFNLHFTILPEGNTTQQKSHLQFPQILKLDFIQIATFLQLLQVL